MREPEFRQSPSFLKPRSVIAPKPLGYAGGVDFRAGD